MKLLVVEDQPKVAGFLKKGLKEEGWQVTVATNGEQALRYLAKTAYDLIVLDIMLPGIDGLEVLQLMREDGDETPVLLLTARDSVSDRVTGLQSGADDYLVKPFAFEELLARLQVLLRRHKRIYPKVLKAADLEMDTVGHLVKRSGKKIELSPLEFRLLQLFLQNKNHVLSRLSIEEEIWGNDGEQETNIVDVYVNYLRKKIDRPFEKPLIKTVRGFGYKLEDDAEK